MVRSLFKRSTWSDTQYVAEALRRETTGGFLMLIAAAAALVWVNVDSSSYFTASEFTIGPASLHLDLDLATWAADGLLAVFFFVAGLELKREMAVGSLSRPSEAAMPIIAAVCGMVAPALVYVVINVVGSGDMRGWAVPTATDIAFALAVLAVIGSQLPAALRAFLLTLAVVDDLLAITIIAVFFTSDLDVGPLLGAAAILAIYFLLQRLNVTAWWIYVPMALVAWVLMHESGVHATVVGVAFGLLTRAHRHKDEHEAPAERIEHRVRPFSAVICVPVFALFAAGVVISGDLLREAFTNPVALGVIAGLLAGKALGIFGGTYLAARFSRAEMSDDLSWSDLLGLSLLAGIGFTVSLLIGDLAFQGGSEQVDLVKMAVLLGSVLSAVAAALVLVRRNTVYRRIAEVERRDDNRDGIPDVFDHAEPDTP